MPRSSIRRLFNAARELEAQGAAVIRLDIGDPDFDMPERMAQAISHALQQGQTHYSPMWGLPELRQAIARHVNRRFAPAHSQISWEHVVTNQGATQALNASFQLACSQGEAAMLPEIYFPNYMQQLCLAGIAPVAYPFDQRFQPRFERFEELVRDGLRALLINSPSNPTGAVFPEATIRQIYNFARRHNLWLISDEAYVDFIYDGDYVSPLTIDLEYPEAERRVLAIFSFSKSFAATGLRMGWTVCPRIEIANQLGLMNEPLTGSLTTPLQFGMLAALEQDDAHERREVLRQRRDVATAILNEAGFNVEPPAGGIFYFLDISATGLDSDTFADRLLAEEKVALVPGSGFGLSPIAEDGITGYQPSALARRCVRLCFARPEELLAEGVRRLAGFMQRQAGLGIK